MKSKKYNFDKILLYVHYIHYTRILYVTTVQAMAFCVILMFSIVSRSSICIILLFWIKEETRYRISCNKATLKTVPFQCRAFKKAGAERDYF